MSFKDNSEYFKMLSAFEQAGATLRPIAAALSTYMNALVDSGFTRPEALELVKILQEKVISHGFEMAMKVNQNKQE